MDMYMFQIYLSLQQLKYLMPKQLDDITLCSVAFIFHLMEGLAQDEQNVAEVTYILAECTRV